MDEQTIIIWGNGKPAAISESIATKHGLSRGQQITDSALFAAILEENNARNACSIEAQRNGEECIVCGS